MPTTDITHLHVHTDFSILDGLGKIEDYVARAKRIGQSSLGIMDHGTLGGAPEFYWAARKEDINPVLGSEFYFVDDAEVVREDKDAERFHIGIIGIGEEGFKILARLSTQSHRRFYYKPLLDRKLIESLDPDERAKLVVLTGCAASIVSRETMNDIKRGKRELAWWKSQFPNLYVELQSHDTEFDAPLNRKLLKLARHMSLPIVVTNDPHYVNEEEAGHHDALLCIQTAANIDDEDRFRFSGSGYHLRTRREMRAAFSAYPTEVWKEGAANTLRIAELCKTRIPAWESRTWRIPKFPDTDDAYGTVKRLVVEALAERTAGMEPSEVRVRRQRAGRELKAIKQVNISDFLLITLDVIQEAKRRGIPVGPGRGSVCGSYVAYLLGIHKIDSIRYGLLFERFLNPERPKMPDIDTDFAPSRRHEIFEYVEEKYGREYVMRVCAYDTMRLKAAFGGLAKSYGIDYLTAQKYVKEMGSSSGHEEDEESPLPQEVRDQYPDLAERLDALIGTKKAISRHAAGVVIFSPEDTTRDLVPEQYIASSKTYLAQYDLDGIEKSGWLKEDFLGLRTLETIDDCLTLIKQRYGFDLHPDEWLPDEEDFDSEVYKMLANGDVAGVFQFEGGTNARGIKEIAPTKFNDLCNCTALYRKGPIDAGADGRFLANKHDGVVRVLHPLLEPILSSTWGEMIYQEQMMEILNKVGNFTMSEVDEVKEVVRKKDPAQMATYKQKFLDGCAANGVPKKAASQIWAMIQTQSGYLFNLSHATAYSFTSYQTARLKYLYPLEFTCALLRTVDASQKVGKDKRAEYMVQAARADFKILPPCIQQSENKAIPEGSDSIRLGLQDIKGVGGSAVRKLLDTRSQAPFESVMDVDEAVNNIGVVKALRESGALECLGRKGEPDRQEELLGWQFGDAMAAFRRKYARRVRLPERNNQRVVIMGEIAKIEKRNRRADGVPFRIWTLRWSPGVTYDVIVGDDARELWDLDKGSIVVVRGTWKVGQYQSLGVYGNDQVTIVKEKKVASATSSPR